MIIQKGRKDTWIRLYLEKVSFFFFNESQQATGILIIAKTFTALMALYIYSLILFSQETYEVDTIFLRS